MLSRGRVLTQPQILREIRGKTHGEDLHFRLGVCGR